MHPSSESFSFGTLKDITLFFFFNYSHLQQHNANPKNKKNETTKETKAVWEFKGTEKMKSNEKAR